MKYTVSLVYKPYDVKLIRNKVTYTKAELDDAVQIAREEGKIQGLAYGIYTLFHQDAIKKPEEMVVNIELLNLTRNDLDLVGILIGYELNDSIKMLESLIKGDRSKAIALAIKSDTRWWSLDDPPYGIKNLTKGFLGCS